MDNKNLLWIFSAICVSPLFWSQSGCILPLEGVTEPLPPSPAFTVTPNFICSGETVELEWSFRSGVGLNVTSVPGLPDPMPVRNAPSGSGSDDVGPINRTTTYAARVRNSQGSDGPARERRVTVVPTASDGPPESVTITFPDLTCGLEAAPLTVNLHELEDPIIGSDDVRITRVRNVSGYTISLGTSDPDRGPEVLFHEQLVSAAFLAADARTGRLWTATPLNVPVTPSEDCGENDALGRGVPSPTLLPPPTVEITMVCAARP